MELWTDGAVSGNPGPGGWAWLLVVGERITAKDSGYGLVETNNSMELTAVLRGLEALPEPSEITVVTDSKYVINGCTKWLAKWKANNWMTGGKEPKPVANRPLFEALEVQMARHYVTWRHVHGHGKKGYYRFNEIADGMAVRAKTHAIYEAREKERLERRAQMSAHAATYLAEQARGKAAGG